ncbi:ADP-ribosylation factor-like protein 6-interacting protein 1 [Panonychus citri]|uniref:ADP-ribosylation factor-like protein 6-interacting protein 1 n=1 Tax=Panonychus citri TaxID=50023 RepID=UPI002306DFA0|nr:ADP-ribosylation factor-like protein 6-interacting protein 1 [Panonychus citri]
MSTTESPKSLEKCLQGWRCVLVQAYPLITWDKPYYPYILSGTIATIFLIIWLSNATILTTFSLIGLIVTIADYVVPLISTHYLEPRFWQDSDEEKYKKIVYHISQGSQTISSFINYLKDLKSSNSKIYFPILFISLSFSAWIGNLVNNLLLTFIMVNFIVLLPGLRHHGYIDKAHEQVRGIFAKVLGGSKKKD